MWILRRSRYRVLIQTLPWPWRRRLSVPFHRAQLRSFLCKVHGFLLCPRDIHGDGKVHRHRHRSRGALRRFRYVCLVSRWLWLAKRWILRLGWTRLAFTVARRQQTFWRAPVEHLFPDHVCLLKGEGLVPQIDLSEKDSKGRRVCLACN
jgi:hypothetical protein